MFIVSNLRFQLHTYVLPWKVEARDTKKKKKKEISIPKNTHPLLLYIWFFKDYLQSSTFKLDVLNDLESCGNMRVIQKHLQNVILAVVFLYLKSASIFRRVICKWLLTLLNDCICEETELLLRFLFRSILCIWSILFQIACFPVVYISEVNHDKCYISFLVVVV